MIRAKRRRDAVGAALTSRYCLDGLFYRVSSEPMFTECSTI